MSSDKIEFIVGENGTLLPVEPESDGESSPSETDITGASNKLLAKLNDHLISNFGNSYYEAMRDSEMKRYKLRFRSYQYERRTDLLCFIKKVVNSYHLHRHTKHLAAYFLDCFMDVYTVPDEKLDLFAMTSLLVASKLEESDAELEPPKFRDLNRLFGNIYTLAELTENEYRLIRIMQYSLNHPTAISFFDYFAARKHFTPQDYDAYMDRVRGGSELQSFDSYESMAGTVNRMVYELIDMSLEYVGFVNERPSIIASACIAVVRRIIEVAPIWSAHLVRLTKYTGLEVFRAYERFLYMYKHEICNDLFSIDGSSNSNVWLLCDSVMAVSPKPMVLDEDSPSGDRTAVQNWVKATRPAIESGCIKRKKIV